MNLNSSSSQTILHTPTISLKVFDDEAKANYAYKGNEWVGFDDPSSVIHKTKWIKDNGYAGGMIWSMDLDDFRGLYQ